MDVSVLRSLLLLVCACGAVNVLFYSLNRWPTTMETVIQAEKFKDLQDLDVRDNGEFLKNRRNLAENREHQSTFMASQGVAKFFRKLKNAAIVESTTTRDSESGRSKETERLFNFNINPHNACERNISRYGTVRNIAIMVISAIRNFYRREAIRNTWGSVVHEMNASLTFLVGISRVAGVQEQLDKESELYGDVIQVEIPDAYENLTLKSIAMLQWFNDYCTNAQFFLKADDDMYINVQNIVKAAQKRHEKRFFLCHVFKNAPPSRDSNSKWFTSYSEFNRTYFPTYCSGTSYLISSAILRDVYTSSMKTKLIKMEDVFISGLVPEHLHVSHIHNDGFSWEKRAPSGCAFKKALTGHQVTVKQMYRIFAELTSNEVDCDTKVNKVLKRAEDGLFR